MATIGTVLANRYRVDRMLTIGALEALYQGWDLLESTSVIICELLPQQNAPREVLEQRQAVFRDEATKLMTLDHPHLIRILAAFCETPQETPQAADQQLPHAYLVYPDLPGRSLASLLEREGPVQEERARAWAAELLDALAYLHHQGVVHRDIRPDTIWITPDDRALLTHIEVSGLWDPRDPATWTAKRVMGTPYYAPPEQWDMRVGRIDARSDLFSLGATLYHALTGERPLTAAERTANPYQFLQVKALRPHVSPSMEAIILKAMELAPSRRFQSAEAMAAALTADRDRAPMAPPPPAPFLPHRKEPPWRRLFGLAASALILIGAGLVGLALSEKLPQDILRPQGITARPSSPSTAAETRYVPAVQPATPSRTALTTEVTPTMVSVSPPTSRLTEAPSALPGLALTPPPSWRLALSETFDSNINGWPARAYTDDWGGVERSVTDGVYRWVITATLPVGRWATPEIPLTPAATGDFLVRVDALRQKGPAEAAYGLVLRHSEGSYYLFSVRDDGFFQFNLWTGFAWQPILDWTASTRIRPETVNTLAVLAKGTRFHLYINDEFVATAEDATLSGGEVGLSVATPPTEGTAVFIFDNLRLWVP